MIGRTNPDLTQSAFCTTLPPMFVTPHHKTALSLCVDHALMAGLGLFRSMVLVCMLAWTSGFVAPAWAQSAPPVSSNPEDILADKPTAAGTSRTEDPMGQMLQDKGLINTQAILEAANQTQQLARAKVRDWTSDLVVSAMAYLGVPYRYGGNSQETGFDCSGFTSYVYARVLGVHLPRRASEQAQMAGMQNVEKSELRPGDLVFFNTLRRTFSHVGIYIGENRFIHAPRSGTVVRIEDMGQNYWQQRFNGARRANVASTLAAHNE
jgi:cell wall-associated NlpC family hydrolase